MEKNERIWNRRFILLFITNLLVLAAFYASIPIIPLYCEEIGITGSKVGIVLTAMSVATILFRPVAGYLLDNFNRYRVYLIFLALFCLSFPAFLAFPVFGALIVVRLYMGAVYSVCGSATMTLAGDVLPAAKVTQGISRFAFTVSIGMALGPFVGLQVQENLSSRASFLTIFGIAVAALVCVSLCRIKYPKVQRGRFSLKESIYAPALPFMLNMMFLMIPYGAVIAYSSILAQEKGLTPWLPYFYVFLVAGMLASKLSTQKHIDAGNHRALVCASLLSCAGQLCQKQATRPSRRGRRSRHILFWLGMALLCLGCGMLLWLSVLQSIPVSIAYPMLSLNFVWVTLAGWGIWHEPVARRHWLGVGLIVVGIVILGTSV